jgi:hypothetical protein
MAGMGGIVVKWCNAFSTERHDQQRQDDAPAERSKRLAQRQAGEVLQP